jgi:hypothetical protein
VTAIAPAGAYAPSSRAAFAQAFPGPARREIVRFGWRSDDGHLQLSGSGAARIAPPDSLRADIAASLGIGRATVILTGDSGVAQPPGVVDQVLPDRFALWAVLGIARLPPGDVTIERSEEGGRSMWRRLDAKGRTTTFELNSGVLVSVSRAEGGRATSQLLLTRDADGTVRRASLTDLARGLRLEIAVTSREASAAFPPETWRLGP